MIEYPNLNKLISLQMGNYEIKVTPSRLPLPDLFLKGFWHNGAVQFRLKRA